MLKIYIGHDSREQEAYDVCSFSLRSRSTKPLHITPLKHRPLRKMGLFSRPWTIDSNGQFVDQRDGLPFSTEFSHTRFLVPEVERRDDGAGWALFCDCDFLFLDDISKLFSLADDNFAVMVVKHNYAPPEGVKMDDMRQTTYRRKNWSSLILWNLSHPANDTLTPLEVNYRPGWWLHGFQWLKDEEIGELPEMWNFLAGWSEEGMIKAIHYTSGGPWMEGYENCPLAANWWAETQRMRRPERAA